MRATGLVLHVAGRGQPICEYSLARATMRPDFAEFPAVVRHGAPAAIHQHTAQDRRYRTMLGTAAAAGPNFAGNYTIASWGCGSACVQWATIDAVSGRLTWPAGLSTVSAAHLGGPSPDDMLPLRFPAGKPVVAGARCARRGRNSRRHRLLPVDRARAAASLLHPGQRTLPCPLAARQPVSPPFCCSCRSTCRRRLSPSPAALVMVHTRCGRPTVAVTGRTKASCCSSSRASPYR